MNTATKYLGTIVLSAGLLLGATACGGDDTPDAGSKTPAGTASADAAAAEKEMLTPAHAAEAIEGFFAATTSDEIAAAYPDKADEKTFSKAVRLTDPQAGTDQVAAAVADFALVKVSDAKADLSISVDQTKVVLKERTASVPASAITVKSGDKVLENSAALAESVNDLVFRDGAWLITFPEAPVSSASASGAATPSGTASPSSK